MNHQHENDPQWQAALDRELKGLPELPAPDTLAPRVMAAIRRRETVSWYAQPWPRWPAVLRAASLAVLLAFFGGACFASVKFFQAGSVAAAMQGLGEWMSGAGVLLATLSTLAGAVKLTVANLGTGFFVAFLLVALINYAACVGLGTMFVRFAFVRRN